MLVLEGLQYTGFRSGSPLTRKVYCGTAGTLFPAQHTKLSGQAGAYRLEGARARGATLERSKAPCTG